MKIKIPEKIKSLKGKIKISIRTAMSFVVFAVILASTLLAIGLYYLFVFFNLIQIGKLPPFWILVIVLLVCNIIGAIVAGIVFSKYTKPLDESIQSIDRLAQGDFDVKLDAQKDRHQIKQLKESINKTAAELNSTEVMRNDFINTISHEYKTPVASIIGFAHRLKNEQLSEEKKNEYLDIIIDESKHLSSMTNNILLMTKFENTEIISDKEPYSLDEQIRKCFQFLQQEWMEKNINVSGDFNRVMYTGNEELMNHVWINLIKNAVKYTDENGEINCRVYEENHNAVVIIQDNGCGMSEETQKHIFDKFYQADSSRRTDGNGLGLSVVKRLVDLCTGTIEVQSELQKGTSFKITLPN
ncbi:MAG: ATP-binding protein [Eubacterium sp.]